jgi:hypothetical protein
LYSTPFNSRNERLFGVILHISGIDRRFGLAEGIQQHGQLGSDAEHFRDIS